MFMDKEKIQKAMEGIRNPPPKRRELVVSVAEYEFLKSIEDKNYVDLTEDEKDRFKWIQARVMWR